MEAFSFGGWFQDASGREPIDWHARPADRGVPAFELHAVIRGAAFSGYDFDGLDPDDPAQADAAGLGPATKAGELGACLLGGDLPCTIAEGGVVRPGTVSFELDLRAGCELRVRTTVGGAPYEAAGDLFEDALLALEGELPSGVRLVCCLTCLMSDYSPAGQGLTGMHCHRDAAQQYLAVRGKADYWSVPVTEIVMETYVCPRWQRRIPGTGYRG